MAAAACRRCITSGSGLAEAGRAVCGNGAPGAMVVIVIVGMIVTVAVAMPLHVRRPAVRSMAADMAVAGEVVGDGARSVIGVAVCGV
jgi:hypothetical protein